jgi:hypothetical protein
VAQGPGPTSNTLQELRPICWRRFHLTARARGILQASNAFGLVSPNPAAHRLLILADNGGNLMRDQVLFSREQDHLGTGAYPDGAGHAVAVVYLRQLPGTELFHLDRLHSLVLTKTNGDCTIRQNQCDCT